MHVREVGDAQTRRQFLELPVQLYKNEPNWIRPLDQDIEGVFDPKKTNSSGMVKPFAGCSLATTAPLLAG
ncbi:hypothetical protein [Cesiribacter andamanensis]|uniref:Uncharacterized protein n=1 Tax=Cesiribacter andamanensis AMV16 TaxID=1279009 RepID=M7N227_9BACT|nr:hypothetical protein [Cesiribacter andamanensis]EMR01362.1 hypothetical protein ADICEAN_03519 [Cesiribacter andamanensis AMV16]